MRKVISGARYDTDTARRLAHWSSGDRAADSSTYLEEALFRTKSGRYFLHGSGGARSCYASALPGGGLGPGEDIVVISEAEARSLAEAHCAAEEFEAIFGTIEQGRIQRTFYLSPAADQHLNELKKRLHMTAPQIVDKALLAYQPETDAKSDRP